MPSKFFGKEKDVHLFFFKKKLYVSKGDTWKPEKKKASPSLKKKKNPIKWHSRSSHKMPDNVSFQ